MRRALLGMAVAGVGAAMVLAPPARAACHAFAVAVSPADPAEGATVEVTVSRDAGVNPSSVRVRTVDGTARAGEDYEAVDRRIDFTTEIEQSFTMRILDDTVDEPVEQFRITLSEGGGCQVNPNFRYGEVTVSVQDDDEPATTTTPPTQPTTTAVTAAPTTEPDTSGTTEPEGTTTSSSEVPPTLPSEEGLDDDGDTTTTAELDEAIATAADDDDDGNGAIAAVAAVLAVAALAGTGYAVHRFRAARSG